MSENTQVAQVNQPTPAEKFALAVEKQYSSNNGAIEMSSFQKKLAQNYFIAIDQAIKDSENKRKQYEPLQYSWQNMNLDAKFYFNVMAYSAIGLDPCQKNHLSIILYKNNKLGKYDISFTIGYVGLELKAKKYGFDIPKEVITEVVYTNDIFKQYKRNRENKVESYDFEVVDDFDRGEIKGGFYYLIYEDETKNRIRVFNMYDIEKRIPKYAAAEFWGGEKDIWKDGQKTGEKEEVEGWRDEMVLKTLKRAAYDSIPIDSAKIDENLMQVIQAEKSNDVEGDIKYEIEQKANSQHLDFEEAKLIQEASSQKIEINANSVEPIPVEQAFESNTNEMQFPTEPPFA
ncbi:recombinase RecT [Empedobacter sp.]|uniref:recombinase RecT n=1 Tax=Empedobacter sp. TaxID=1927715 RepID=UPI0028AC148C|nr:recombinase RecT [Empedobacter sp.]